MDNVIPSRITKFKTACFFLAQFITRALVVCLIGAIADRVLSLTALWEMSGTAYSINQVRLQQASTSSELPVVLLDLGTLIRPRAHAFDKPSVAESSAELAPQWTALSTALEAISMARPKAIIINWELGLDAQFLKRRTDEFEFQDQVPEETRAAYLRMMASIASINKGVPILFVADNAYHRSRGLHGAFPRGLNPDLAVSSPEIRSFFGAYPSLVPDEPRKGMELLPPTTSGEVLRRIGVRDQLLAAPSTCWGLFHAEEEIDGRRFYLLNLAHLPQLISESISVPLNDLGGSEISKRIAGKVVVLGDVQSNFRSDTFQLPGLGAVWQQTPSGRRQISMGSGSQILASAILTRSQETIYGVSESGAFFWITVGGFSLLLQLLSQLIFHLARNRITNTGELFVEILVMLGSVILLWSLIWFVPFTRVLFVALPIWTLTRFADLFISVLRAWRHFVPGSRRKRSRSDFEPATHTHSGGTL
jgi:hypothetical protein